MKTEVKKIDGNKREVAIEVTGDIVKNKFEDAFKKIAQEAKVPGFRPGNAPRDILEKNFSHQAHDMVLKDLIPEVYNQAIEKEGLDVIELPDISDVKLDRTNLAFKAVVEVSPEIKLKNYKGIPLTYKKVETSPEELKRSLDALQESRKIDKLDDELARSLSYPNLGELKSAMERQIFIQKENEQRQSIENQIIEAITKDLNFSLPQSLVKRQLDDLLKQAKVSWALKGVPREKIDEQEKELVAQLRPQAENQVKVYLVLAQIAKKENIPVDDHMSRQVMEFLLKEANWQAVA